MTGCSYSNCQIGTLHRRCRGVPSQRGAVPGYFCTKALPLLFTNLFALVRFAHQYPDLPHPSRSLQHTLIAIIMFHFTMGAMPWLLLAVSRFGKLQLVVERRMSVQLSGCGRPCRSLYTKHTIHTY